MKKFKPEESMQASYRFLLKSNQSKACLLIGMISRFPISAAGVAIVIAVSDATSSYARAGIASAVYVLAATICTPLWARRMDRIGQSKVLRSNGVIQFLLFNLLAYFCLSKFHELVLYLICAGIGLFAVDIGSAVRSRWLRKLNNNPAQRTAFILESAVDEGMFALAPLLVTIAAAWNPAFSPIVVSFGPIVGWVLLSSIKEPERHGIYPGDERRISLIKSRNLLLLFGIFVSLGAMLGSIEVLLISSAMSDGKPIHSGIALAGWALGSGFTALIFASWIARCSSKLILMLGLILMSSFTVLLGQSSSLYWQITICFIAGCGAAPAISAGFSLASEASSKKSVTEAMAWMSAGLSCGTVIGASGAGFIVDQFSSDIGYYCSASVGFWGFILTLIYLRKPVLSIL